MTLPLLVLGICCVGLLQLCDALRPRTFQEHFKLMYLKSRFRGLVAMQSSLYFEVSLLLLESCNLSVDGSEFRFLIGESVSLRAGSSAGISCSSP